MILTGRIAAALLLGMLDGSALVRTSR